ncbi:MAG: threonylcarbamoyl-AMP synthase [Crocinitomicaceae bacterium]|nr:threonylcarbamoyl-AMP synthase [Crocinitomicaceae bacterium]
MLIELFPQNIDMRKLGQAVEVLRSGGILIYPTDTVYSIGCALGNTRAIERVAKLKKIRPEKAHFSLICYDLSHLSDYCKPIDNRVFKMMKSILPGPYTLILEANRNIPKIFSSNKKTIGIRVPDNPITRMLVKELGSPIIATSVIDEDDIVEYTADPLLIHEKWERLVDLVIDGGPGGLEPSTIIDCTRGTPEIIRVGKGPSPL